MSFYYLLAMIGTISLSYCRKNAATPPLSPFDSIPGKHQLLPLLNEVSGIADSKVNSGYLWGQEDSGNPSVIYLIAHNGVVDKSIHLKGISNRDWEEITLSNGWIYLAETGDNAQVYGTYRFYRFPEPLRTIDTVHQIETIPFTYEDGNHDSEAFLVDPWAGDIYILTKRDNPARIYKLTTPYSTTNTAIFEAELPYSGVVGASISADGKEILVKTYGAIRYYKHTQGSSITESLKGPYTMLPYKSEPQGEAICFAQNGSGFYTLSERISSGPVHLYFYKRN